MKERQRHGEAGSAQLDEDTERIMQEIRDEYTKYPADCVYNMDETGSYWKMKPDRSLSTFEESGRKKDKARITVNLTCNTTGIDRLPLWFIGKAKRPNCFRAEHLQDLESLGAFWRYNDTA
jgi:DDE superfamily endonuclease